MIRPRESLLFYMRGERVSLSLLEQGTRIFKKRKKALTSQTVGLRMAQTDSLTRRILMGRELPELPDAELAVLQALWQRGPATIRQLTEALYPGGSEAHYATVQKLLDRLEAKRCVQRDRSTHAHLFCAAVDRNDLIGSRLEALAERLCGGSLTPLVTNLVRSKRLSARERREIRRLMDELDS
jgi:BlaI family transcriptional regulator, penicillinase repressor